MRLRSPVARRLGNIARPRDDEERVRDAAPVRDRDGLVVDRDELHLVARRERQGPMAWLVGAAVEALHAAVVERQVRLPEPGYCAELVLELVAHAPREVEQTGDEARVAGLV